MLCAVREVLAFGLHLPTSMLAVGLWVFFYYYFACMFCVCFDVAGTHLAIDIEQTASRSVTERYVHIGALDRKIYD